MVASNKGKWLREKVAGLIDEKIKKKLVELKEIEDKIYKCLEIMEEE